MERGPGVGASRAPLCDDSSSTKRDEAMELIDSSEIVVTAARAPAPAPDRAASVSVIDKGRIERLGEPLVPALLRLVPSASVSTSGPSGSFTEVRIRGAEAYHS